MTLRPVLNGPIAAFAYLRQLPGMDTEAVQRTLTALQAFAGRQGLALAGVHHERRPSERLTTWAGLIVDCRNEGVTNIVVPGPHHFHHDDTIAAFMREELESKIRGTVWCASEAAPMNVMTTTEAGPRDH